MLNFISSLKEQIEQILTLQLKKAIEAKELPEAEFAGLLVEYTPNKPFGDFASNVALFCAKKFKMSPQELAELILKDLDLSQTEFSSVNFKNGFLNFKLSSEFYNKALKQILEAKADYGTVNVGNGKQVIIEFVSANPTGPMHLGNAR
ncbi:MAG: arginine--tRNA ligase, partial [Oscillospiraceae bacterium]